MIYGVGLGEESKELVFQHPSLSSQERKNRQRLRAVLVSLDHLLFASNPDFSTLPINIEALALCKQEKEILPSPLQLEPDFM